MFPRNLQEAVEYHQNHPSIVSLTYDIRFDLSPSYDTEARRCVWHVVRRVPVEVHPLTVTGTVRRQ